MHTCPNCRGGQLKIIAAILERQVIEKSWSPGLAATFEIPMRAEALLWVAALAL
jgi:hypothetical protein